MRESEIKRRLRWKARRGMLELDLIFSQFLDDEFDQLDAAQQQSFAALLGLEDDMLYRWLMGHEAVHDEAYKAVVSLIQSKIR